MDETITDYFQMKLLQIPKRERQLDGSIEEFYNQPERSKRENYEWCVVCKTYSREPEKGSGCYCHKCREYDYA